MNLLKQWSNKNIFNIIFDSRDDGDGSNNVLYNRVLNECNLYFISSDNNNNVYNGYINTKIDMSTLSNYIHDRNSFIFSLIRDGKVNKKKYFIKQIEGRAFTLWNNHLGGDLYEFGDDIGVWKVGSNESCCNNNEHCCYEYKNDKKPFTDITFPNSFVVQRIVVIEMN